MDYRTQAFLTKFQSAMRDLEAPAFADVTSIKLRGEYVEHTHFERFIQEYIGRDCGLTYSALKSEYQGGAWLITDADGNHLILVEHESGLEILYIAGSIASLISIIPLIIKGWKATLDFISRNRAHFSSRYSTEIRRIDAERKLNEKTIASVEEFLREHNRAKRVQGTRRTRRVP